MEFRALFLTILPGIPVSSIGGVWTKNGMAHCFKISGRFIFIGKIKKRSRESGGRVICVPSVFGQSIWNEMEQL